MTKNEFERLRVFLKRYPKNRISFENVYVYFHCVEADTRKRADRFDDRDGRPIRSEYEIRKELGKLGISLDYLTLQVDIENNVLIGRPHSYGNKKVKPVKIPRKEIKKINLVISYYPTGNVEKPGSSFSVRF